MKKKLLALLLAFVMVFSTMAVSVYADEDELYNFDASVFFDNYYCECMGSCDVKVVIEKDGAEYVIAPMIYEEDSNWFYFDFSAMSEADRDAVEAMIEEVGTAYDAVDFESIEDDDARIAAKEQLMADFGYKISVVIEDNDAEHEIDIYYEEFFVSTAAFYVDFYNSLSGLIIYGLEEEFKEAYEELYPDKEVLIKKVEGEYVVTIKDAQGNISDLEMIDVYDVYEEIITDEEMIELIEDIAANMAEIEVGAFYGDIFIEADAACSCPEMTEVTLYHEYYDIDGNYVDSDLSFMVEKLGAVLPVSDLETVTEVDGVEYEVEGVYLYDYDAEDWDYENPVTEITVEDYQEVLIVYVEAAEEEGAAGSIENEGTTGSGDVSADDKSPKTGDDFNPAPFIALMAAAVAVMGVAVRRRHQN